MSRRSEAIRNGANPEMVQLQPPPSSAALSAVGSSATTAIRDVKALAAGPQWDSEFLQNTDLCARQLGFLATHGMAEAMGEALARLISNCSRDKLRILANGRVETGETLLMASAAQGLGSVVQVLLDIGADPNATAGADQETALDLAADAGYFPIAQTLIAGGADASKAHKFAKVLSNEREYAGESTTAGDGVKKAASGPASKINLAALGPLGRAAFAGDVAATTELLEGDGSSTSRCDVEEGAGLGCAPFLLASMQHHPDLMELLLSHGANINTTSKHGWTPLMLATQRGDERCVGWLIDHGADVNHLSPGRWTALAEATNKGFTQIMALLLDAGADPEIRAQSDWAPIMHAAYRGDIEAVNMLLDAGASFEEISARDATVMLLGAAAGSVPVVKRLLAAGCPPDSRWSRAPETPEAGRGAMESAGAEDGPLPAPKQQERIERAYRVGWTPLMVACQVGSLEIVTLLLDAGANPVPKSPMFKTALEIAMENGKSDVAEYLKNRLGERGVSESV